MYQALYRKYRPKSFKDVMGQEFVIETLKNSVIYNKINHAYMFFGPRGIGKTTIAKIFARMINCENPKDGNPCEQCENCLRSKDKETVDIIEIDAASNNGVDEIREIKSKVNIVPSDLKYKVYIIDEVHMLTSGAFNALLKTLEEPPKHVVFILATTDPQKVSETIISRCQCYSFKRISIEQIIQKLKQIAEEESIQVQDQVLEQIAISSNGGLRDSIGCLDKISSYKQSLITLEDYLQMNDLISKEEIEDFTHLILSCNIKKVISKFNQYDHNGKNLIEIMNQIIYYLKDSIVDYYLNDTSLKDELWKYQLLVNCLNEKMFDVKKAADPKIYIELVILKLIEKLKQKVKIEEKSSQIISREIILDEHSKEENENISQSEKQEKTITENKSLNLSQNSIEKETNNEEGQYKSLADVVEIEEESNLKEIMKIRLNNALALAEKEEKNLCEKEFQKLNDSVFDQKIGYVVSELLNSTIRVVSKDIMIISYEYASVVEQNLKMLDSFCEVLNSLTNINKKIGIITDEMWNLEKQKYIKATKNNQKYDIIEEPELIKKDSLKEENDLSLLDDFGDIVEIN